MPQKLGVYWVTRMGVGVASMHSTGAGGATTIPWVDMQVGCTHVCSPIHVSLEPYAPAHTAHGPQAPAILAFPITPPKKTDR